MNRQDKLLQSIAGQLAEQGYAIINNALPDELTQQLYQRVTTLAPEAFKPAGIGRSQAHRLDESYRRDQIHWLDSSDPAQSRYLAWMEMLRQGINQQLFMGLFDYESHFAHYAPGTFYKRHLDAFKGETNRVVTTVFYLNPEWYEADGGEIVLYADEQQDQPFTALYPHAGTLLLFLSDQFPHEVRCAQRDRYSIAGWFRVKSLGTRVDPPH